MVMEDTLMVAGVKRVTLGMQSTRKDGGDETPSLSMQPKSNPSMA